MKKVLFIIIVAACLIPINFVNQGYCGGKIKRVLRNCGIQDEKETDIMFGPCKHLDGFTNVILGPKQALIWDEMVYFPPKITRKTIVDFLGFVPRCDEIAVEFNGETMKKQCIRNGKNEEMLYVAYDKNRALGFLEENDGFIHVEIKNTSKNIINVIIKRVEPPSELENGKIYYVKK